MLMHICRIDDNKCEALTNAKEKLSHNWHVRALHTRCIDAEGSRNTGLGAGIKNCKPGHILRHLNYK